MTSCQCANPPGGSLQCSDDQLAICEVEKGVPTMYCVDVPVHRNLDERNRWVFSVITKTKRLTALSGRDMAMLESGVYRDKARDREVRFQLPRTDLQGARTIATADA